MYKEIIITLVVIAIIVIGNIITQNNTKNAVEEIKENLTSLRGEIIKDNVNKDESEKKMKDIYENWKVKNEVMAYYIEHNELEKVEVELTKLKADIETEEYKMAVENLDNCSFILEHIKDKTALKIVNIF